VRATSELAVAITLALALGVAACGGATDARDASQRSPAVAAALQKAKTIAGHEIELAVDPEITRARSRDEIDDMIAHAARAVATDLSLLQRDDPEVFVRQVSRLRRIECRYGDSAARDARFEGTSFVITRRFRWQVLVEGDLAKALRDDFYATLEERFGALEPEQVAPGDRADYFLYVRHERRGGARVPHETTVERVLRLAQVAAQVTGASDPTLAASVRAWLFAEAKEMTRGDARARPAWLRWLNATLPSATTAEKLAIARAVHPLDGRDGEDRLPGFDSFAFDLAIADDWIAAGHPAIGARGEPRFELFDLVLAPPIVRDGKLTRNDSGRAAWVRDALVSDARMRRLVDALVARNDPALTTAVVFNLRHASGAVSVVDFLRALERSPRTWQQAVLILIQEQRDQGCVKPLVDSANRVWRDAPAARGTALHVVACKEARWRGVSDKFFAEFARLYGQSVNAEIFAAFLDDGRDAFTLAEAVWPALGKGWSRVSVIAPRLDAFLSDEHVRAGANGEPMRTLGGIATRLCEDGDSAEIARYHDALSKLARTDAGRARALASVIDDTLPGRCGKKR
jgi:hypothetical protein